MNNEQKYWDGINEVTSLMRRMGEGVPDENIIKNRFQVMVERVKTPFIIKEGLIQTYETNHVVHSISELFNLQKDNENNLTYFEEKDGKTEHDYDGKIEIKKTRESEIILITLYNLSNIENIHFYMKKYGWKCVDTNNNVYIYEKKYDTYILLKHLILEDYNYLYHITTKNVIEKILKQGLIPKKKVNGYIDNDEKNYFFLTQPSGDKLKDFYVYKFKIPVVLLKIDLSKLNPTTKFYNDTRMDDALYTYEPIPNNAIEIIDEYEGK